MDALTFESYRSGAALVVVAPAEIDLVNQQQFEDVVASGLTRGPVIVDFAAVSFFAISAIRVLVRSQRVSQETGCPFALAAVAPPVLDLLALAEICDQLRICRSVEAAERAVRGGFGRFADK